MIKLIHYSNVNYINRAWIKDFRGQGQFQIGHIKLGQSGLDVPLNLKGTKANQKGTKAIQKNDKKGTKANYAMCPLLVLKNNPLPHPPPLPPPNTICRK